MTVTIPQVEASKPEGLTQTATALGQTASSLSSQIDTQRATMEGLRDNWQGPASDAAIATAQPTLLKMQQIHDALNRAQSVLQQGGTELTQTRTNVLQTVSQLSGPAHEGGQLLASDVNALNATHDNTTPLGQGHMTVLGHSYGSTTVSDAAAGYGMHADDVVLVGCPGTDLAHSAADFHLNPGGHLYVGAASSDPVTQLGAIPQIHVPGTDFTASLGDDPAMDNYGSTRFKAEVPGLTTPWGDHSQYYTNGGESLFSMSDIVSGHGDALEHDGMTAPHRSSFADQVGKLIPFGIPDYPEMFRPGTSGHTHQ